MFDASRYLAYSAMKWLYQTVLKFSIGLQINDMVVIIAINRLSFHFYIIIWICYIYFS